MWGVVPSAKQTLPERAGSDARAPCIAQARVTVVALPLVNEWTQDRDHAACRTPRWRGITLFHELRR